MGELITANFGQVGTVAKQVEAGEYNPAGYESDDIAFLQGFSGLMGGMGEVLPAEVRSFAEIKRVAPGLAFTVDKAPLFAKAGVDGEIEVPVKSHVSLVRDDTDKSIGIVGKNYGIIQPEQMWSLFDGHDVEWQMAGTLKGGSVMYGFAKISTFDVVKGDPVVTYMFLHQNFDGMGSCRVIPVHGRPSCMNMVTSILRSNAGLSIKHTRYAAERLGFAARALVSCQKDAEKTQELFKRLAEKRFTATQLHKVLCLPGLLADAPRDPKTGEFLVNNTTRENNREQIMENFHDGRGIQGIPGVAGTAWAALNAVTEYTTHQRTAKGGDVARFDSNLRGTGRGFAQQAIKAICAEAGVAA